MGVGCPWMAFLCIRNQIPIVRESAPGLSIDGDISGDVLRVSKNAFTSVPGAPKPGWAANAAPCAFS